MKINHIGYAVKKIEKAMSAFAVLGFEFGDITDDEDRNVRITFGTKDGYCIELVSPLDRKLPSPVDTHLGSSFGTPYHICYESEDFDKDIAALEEKGFKTIIEPRPAKAFGGRKVVFMMSAGFGLMEIVEA